MINIKKELTELYHNYTKHSHYQNIPKFVCESLNYSESIDENWRGDTARYQYILKDLDPNARIIFGDIGANTGFFTISLAHIRKSSRFYAYEMNKIHIKFMTLIKEYFSMDNVELKSQNVDLSSIDNLPFHDVLLNLNVLHHGGVDFDKSYNLNQVNFSDYAKIYISKIKSKTSRMYFQMGYNWGGDKTKPIISVDKPETMVKYLINLFHHTGWEIKNIALFSQIDKQYHNLPSSVTRAIINHEENNSELLDKIESYRVCYSSEFYKRPILVVSNQGAKKDMIEV